MFVMTETVEILPNIGANVIVFAKSNISNMHDTHLLGFPKQQRFICVIVNCVKMWKLICP